MSSSGGQLLAHLVGDFVIQSDWMAAGKLEAHGPAAAHALSYAACFLPLTRDPRRLAFIAGTHFVIDRWRLARHVVWAKNQLAPQAFRYPWSHAKATGYHGSLVLSAAERDKIGLSLDLMFAASEADLHFKLTGCQVAEKPPWMAVWLMIVADNTIHGLCNWVALRGA